ncbi:MAG: class I SAM-dependent methyltransferase, partial [Candidatus Saccharimonadales bacterium]
MRSHIDTNERLWDELARLHAQLPEYGTDVLKTGGVTLRSLELQLAGSVAQKDLLHLQCHFGLDTLSWVRLGARATGIDFSSAALQIARDLSRDTGIAAQFHCVRVEEAPRVLAPHSFDIVVATYGVLEWIADLFTWSQNIAYALQPGGSFLLIDNHPLTTVLELKVELSGASVGLGDYYFEKQPRLCRTNGSYADRTASLSTECNYKWSHTLAEVINALLSAGIRLRAIEEYPFCHYK